MAEPINYMGAMPQINLAESAVQGLQLGGLIRQQRQQNAADERLQQYRVAMEGAFQSGRPEDFRKLAMQFPEHAESMKPVLDQMTKEQRDAELQTAIPITSALMSGRPEIAKDLLEQQIAALENSGEDVTDLKQLSSAIDRDPRFAMNMSLFTLSKAMDPEKFAETFAKLSEQRREEGMYGANLSEAEAKAQKAAVDARFAESNAVLDLQKKNWDVTKIQNDMDVARENSRIAAINASLSKETNDLKRQELQAKLDEAQSKRDSAVREKSAEIETFKAGINNAIGTIDELLKNPELPNVVGPIQGRDYYPSTLFGVINPAASSEMRANAQATLKTVKSQSFLNNLMMAKEKGATFGSLTEKEGEKLEGYIRSLETSQSDSQIIKNLEEIEDMLWNSDRIMSMKYGVPFDESTRPRDVRRRRREQQQSDSASPTGQPAPIVVDY